MNLDMSQEVNDYKYLDLEGIRKILYAFKKVLNGKILYDTTANWNTKINFIPERGTIIVYTDHYALQEQNDSIDVPGIKIGTGNGYVKDLPFIDDALALQVSEHINNTTIHTTAEEKQFWSNKINVSDSSAVIDDILTFNRN